jgi:hypothetical protein
MNDFLTFRKMITPLIIQILFWIGVVGSILVGLVMMVSGASSDYGGGQSVLMGLFVLLLGPIMVRIYCELLILFFRMNETLTDIRSNTQR